MSVGDEAEDQVQLWGTRAGFVVNPVQRDRHGWDHLFELSLPRPPRSDDPFELATRAFACRVQVKAVTGARRSISIKLSNWKRAIDDALPWFFLVLRFEDREIREAVIVHVDKAVIEQVIARLCSLPQSAKTHLHRKKFALHLSTATVLAPPIERSLHNAIAEVVGLDAFEYAKTKQGWRDNAGYKDKRELNINMTFGPLRTEELLGQLARAAIGLNAIESSQVSLSRTRFGKERALAVPRPVNASLSWSKDGGAEVMLSMSDDEGHHLATVPVLMRSSTRVFPLPDEFWLMRFESLMIDMVINVGARHCSVNYNELADDKPLSLKALHNDLVFLKSLDDHEGTVELSLSRNDYCRPLTQLTAPQALGWRQYLLAIDVIALWPLLAHLGPAHADIRLTPTEISALGAAARTMLMSRTGIDAHLYIDLPIDPGAVDLSKPIVIITNPHIRVGTITFMDLIALIAVPTPLDKEGESYLRVKPERCKLLLSRQYVGDGVNHFDFDESARNAGVQLEKRGHPQVTAINWNRLTKESSKPQTLASSHGP